MWPVARRSGGGGLTCREPIAQNVTDVSPEWGGRATIGTSRVKAIGSKTAARQTGRTPCNTTKTIEKEKRL